MDDDHIINITHIALYAGRMLNKMVERRKIKIRKYLACQVADGKPAVLFCGEQALVFGKV